MAAHEFVPLAGPVLDVLAIGVAPDRVARMRRAGHRVTPHTLDRAPAAELRGRPFVPPVLTWPFLVGSFDRVLLEEDLAHTVADEAALAEAARVLRPGGRLLVRVPQSGPMAWLDGFNVFRYVRDFTKRGKHLFSMRGIGWRRHYPAADVQQLLQPAFTNIAVETRGIGLTELARLGILLGWGWLLRRPDGDAQGTGFLDRLGRWERHVNLGGASAELVVTAERNTSQPWRSERCATCSGGCALRDCVQSSATREP